MGGAGLHVTALSGIALTAILVLPPPSIGIGRLLVVPSSEEPRRAVVGGRPGHEVAGLGLGTSLCRTAVTKLPSPKQLSSPGLLLPSCDSVREGPFPHPHRPPTTFQMWASMRGTGTSIY